MAIWVELSAVSAVGAKGIPVKLGDANGALELKLVETSLVKFFK